ncbi:hypothetical protein Tco_0151156 [Tanacetum coccineum]
MEGVTTVMPITSAEYKAQRRLECEEKADLDTMSIDDLYNNLKVSNKAVNAAHGVTIASTQVNIAYSTNIDNLSDVVICFVLASQLNRQVDHERAKSFLKKTGRKLTVNGNETIGFISPKWSATTATRGDILLGVHSLKKSRQQEGIEGPNYALMAYSSSSSNSEGMKKQKCLPPLFTENFMPPTLDLSGLDEFVNKPVVKNRDEEVSEIVRKNDDAPFIEEWVLDSKEEKCVSAKTKKKTIKHSIAKIEFVKPKQQEKIARKTVKQAEKHRQNTHSPRGNQRNWNNMMSQRLGSNFEMFNKACYVCGSFDHLHVDCNYHQK